ncbi:DUF4025 domain-containing protein [Bacillus sp. HMF5848]|uniref:YozQ family protein n=1 Tax=Bacillus sp. HMF5848 TaxID=2495421 RepID=UPI000F78F391|nr:YozQ family protein [Bacillus sp. HMF5848]RSK27253.1 DUF4025 domain-containing protein [Bacillus sp. HMF5848]
MEKKQVVNSKVAGRTFKPDDYQSSSEAGKGLALTHEQATDSLTEGSIDATIETDEGNIKIPRKGF